MSVSTPLIEIHVPLVPATVPDGEYPYPFLETIEDRLLVRFGRAGAGGDAG